MLPNCEASANVPGSQDHEAYPVHAAIGDLLRQLDGDEKPNLDVGKGFDGLAPLPGVAADARHVLPHAVDCLCAIIFVEEPCIRRRIW